MPAQAAPDFYIDEERPHLGGYIRGGDPATFFPVLWAWLVQEQGVRSVIDVGCGEGHALGCFEALGCRTLGIDGVEQRGKAIIQHDYTQGPLLANPNERRITRGTSVTPHPWADLCWSCEFVEHVEERYVPNFLATFRCAQLVLMTHAEPEQPGYHHVNCQPASYWIGVMAAAGFRHDEELTREARDRAAQNSNPINHFTRSGLAFVRW